MSWVKELLYNINMKKLITVIVLSLLWSNNLLAESNFVCKNINDREREYILSIDLDKKELIRAGTIFPIVEVSNDKIIAKKKYTLGSIKGEIILTFNRYTGLLLYQDWRGIALFDKADFNCKPAPKKLI